MVGWIKPRDKPNEELPSISEQMQKDQANQSTIDKQLKHANEQIAFTRAYPGRTAR
jgi:hypothetical protein